MRKLIYATALALFCSCSGAGTADPDTPLVNNDDQNGKPALEAGYYIYVDKAVIEADGVDKATFSIKDQDGNLISTDENVNARKIWYQNVADETRLDAKSTGITSIVDGEFEFAGIYGTTKTKNTVKVTVQNRAQYEVFHKNVAIFKLTATWCTNCPGMTNVLNSLGEDAKEHSIILACHNSDSYSLDLGSEYDLAAAVALHADPELKNLLLPSNVYDLDVYNSEGKTLSGVTKQIMQSRIDNPACTGIKINSVQMDGTDLKVSATVKASKAGDYDLTCAVLANNVYAPGTQGSVDGYYHHMVVAVNQDNFLNVNNTTKFALAVDGEYTREFVIPMPKGATSAAVLDNLSVAVLSLKKDKSGKAIVDNAAECAYGETADYVYNN